jgi:hypothetical protein
MTRSENIMSRWSRMKRESGRIGEPPADVQDFAEVPAHTEDLKRKYDQDVIGVYIDHVDPDPAGNGAIQLSKNYYDPRGAAAPDNTVPVTWNAFPRALKRWYSADSNPTPANLSRSEQTADVLRPMAYYWSESKDQNGVYQWGFAQIYQDLVPYSATLRNFVKPARFALPDGTPGTEELSFFFRQQDEYCEWHVDRDGNGRIAKITFTAEPPDYWTFLAGEEPELVVKLYQRYVDPSVTRDDLFFKSDVLCNGMDHTGQTGWKVIFKKNAYNPLNKWTTTHGAMHLTHPANTLGAEVNLAARSSVFYPADDEPMPDPIYGGDASLARIACAGYGGINRSSDPKIGATVGGAVAGGNLISLTDPIGLYIDTIDLSSLRGPDGKPIAGNLLTVVRGNPDANAPRILRAELALPAGTNFGLEDCSFDSRPLERAGQIAHQIGMVLYADVRAGTTDPTRDTCQSDFYCRRTPAHSEFFGSFDPASGPKKCADLKDEDWIKRAPYEGQMMGFAGGLGPKKDVDVSDVARRAKLQSSRL